ncbi:TatD family hydrolase [Lentibacillus cibarius]|uniref:Amidohydrolase-related domain-containing protein n=1 Tax=Lentibacillus cibarius TaxID=2583219 RepID=A0A5S3QLR4_9BACI|nr:TatD family hydrolase [Lentibacillus cibarius]TMN22884.1 hypothetical protein FFL34_12905 [Lentibacillus cibarius]
MVVVFPLSPAAQSSPYVANRALAPLFFSLTPDILYKQRTRDLVLTYPLEKMMVETDGPWSFEGILKGKMTHPVMIHHSIREMSDLKRMSVDDVYRQIYENTCRFYRL